MNVDACEESVEDDGTNPAMFGIVEMEVEVVGDFRSQFWRLK